MEEKILRSETVRKKSTDNIANDVCYGMCIEYCILCCIDTLSLGIEGPNISQRKEQSNQLREIGRQKNVIRYMTTRKLQPTKPEVI
jgi:hypothetical protein